MIVDFNPDYRNIWKAATNRTPDRIPLYEHIISESIMEEILNKKFAELLKGDELEQREYIRNYIYFYKSMGYDTVSFERLITAVMPGSGALYSGKEGVIKNRKDFAHYPWNDIQSKFFAQNDHLYRYLAEEMPEGMKAVGGPGNGVFECVQDLVGFESLCYIRGENPTLYSDLFSKMGEVLIGIWKEFLSRHSDCYVVCRFGDDLGFKTSTLLPPKDIKEQIAPIYKKIVDLVHSYNIPFLLHCCGNIFNIMDTLIEEVNIDAKHSNEDTIAPFSVWLKKYGHKIGNFGGVDTNVLYEQEEKEIKNYVRDILELSQNNRGVAIGSGNSIPDYIPAEKYLYMVETVRKYRN